MGGAVISLPQNVFGGGVVSFWFLDLHFVLVLAVKTEWIEAFSTPNDILTFNGHFLIEPCIME